MYVGAESALRMTVGVAHIVAAYLAFTANYANSAHCILHLPGAVFFTYLTIISQIIDKSKRICTDF